VKRRLLAAIAAIAAAAAAWGAPPEGRPSTGEPFGFVAWNPGAALSFLRTGFVTRSILPTALFNQEAGVALAGGWCADAGLVEGRLALGNSNATYFVAQVQLGASWFFGERLGWTRRGPYVGGSLRYWDLVQVYDGAQTHNASPMVHLGWWFDVGPLFVDVRISQVFAVATVSSVPFSTPGFAFVLSPLPGISPVLPIGLVQIGVRIPAGRSHVVPAGASAPGG
jgi:hypothetical protein